jgi:translocator protein
VLATRGGDVTDTEQRDATTPATEQRGPRWVSLLVFVLVTTLAGFVGSLLQGDDVGSRYLALDLPAWAPPQDAFGIVWPILYVLIGIAAWRTWSVAGGVRPAALALGLWAAQLVVNASWSGVFFGLEAFAAAIAVIVVLDVLVVALIAATWRHDRLAAGMLVPYLLWILYATALNIAIYALN